MDKAKEILSFIQANKMRGNVLDIAPHGVITDFDKCFSILKKSLLASKEGSNAFNALFNQALIIKNKLK